MAAAFDQADRRRVSVALTPEGIQAVVGSVQPVVERISQAAAALSDAQREAVTVFLRECAQLLDDETARISRRD